MPHAPLTPFDHQVLDMIEHSPIGAVPRTPTYDESLKRLQAAQQVYHSSDYKDCHVTARSLAKLPVFVAAGLLELDQHPEDHSKLEGNNPVYDRYVASLPAALRTKAEALRLQVSGKVIHHRPKAGGVSVRDPLHSLFLVPGAGPQPGLPGNYLRGTIDEFHDAAHVVRWRIQVMDTDTDAAACLLDSLPEALVRLRELLDCVPFHMSELEALGFEMK